MDGLVHLALPDNLAVASRDNGIESVKKNAPEAPIVEVASA